MVNQVTLRDKVSLPNLNSADLALEASWMEDDIVSSDDLLVKDLLLADEALGALGLPAGVAARLSLEDEVLAVDGVLAFSADEAVLVVEVVLDLHELSL